MFKSTQPHQQIKQGQYTIRMGDRIPDNAVSLAYVYINPLQANENIQITDMASSIAENAIGESVSEIQMFAGSDYLLKTISQESEIQTQNFLITDIFYQDNIQKPLYYKYELKYFIYDKNQSESGKYVGRAIEIKAKNIQPEKDYYFDIYAKKVESKNDIYQITVYTNYEDTVGNEFYLSYTGIEIIENKEKTVIEINELIQPSKIFLEKQDLKNVINSEEKCYYRGNGKEIGSSKIYVNENKKNQINKLYIVKVFNNYQIKVSLPVENKSNENWFLNIQNGKFSRKINKNNKEIELIYFIPEYFQQGFDSYYGFPYMFKEEIGKIINENEIEVKNKPIYVELSKETNKPINMLVKINNIQSEIDTWNTEKGIIKLKNKLHPRDEVLIQYYYLENTYQYKGFYDYKRKKFWYLDLNPGKGHIASIYDLEKDEIRDLDSSHLINKTIYIYIRPAAQIEIVDNNEVYLPERFEFQSIFHSFEPIEESNNEILLAKIQVRANSSKEDIKIVDSRVKGGGLKHSISKEDIENISPNSKSYWDIGEWDGYKYQENGVLIIRLPKFLLKEYGGSFTRVDIERVIKKQIAFGVFYIIEYLDEASSLIEVPKDFIVVVENLPIQNKYIIFSQVYELLQNVSTESQSVFKATHSNWVVQEDNEPIIYKVLNGIAEIALKTEYQINLYTGIVTFNQKIEGLSVYADYDYKIITEFPKPYIKLFVEG